MSDLLREVDKVSFIIHVKLKREDADEHEDNENENIIDLFLLQKAGEMIFPSFQVAKIPANILVKTEQQFQSYCRYFLSNFVLNEPAIQQLSWERMGREVFVYSTLEATKVKPNFFFVTPAEILNQKHYLGTCVSEPVLTLLSTNVKRITKTELFPQVFYLHIEEGDRIYFQKLPLERREDGYFYFSSEIDKKKTNLRYAVNVGKYGFQEMGEKDDTCFMGSNVLVKSRKQFSLLL